MANQDSVKQAIISKIKALDNIKGGNEEWRIKASAILALHREEIIEALTPQADEVKVIVESAETYDTATIKRDDIEPCKLCGSEGKDIKDHPSCIRFIECVECTCVAAIIDWNRATPQADNSVFDKDEKTNIVSECVKEPNINNSEIAKYLEQIEWCLENPAALSEDSETQDLAFYWLRQVKLALKAEQPITKDEAREALEYRKHSYVKNNWRIAGNITKALKHFAGDEPKESSDE